MVSLLVWGGTSYSGYIPWETNIEELVRKIRKVVLLNSPLAFPGFLVWCEEIDVATAAEIVKDSMTQGKEVRSFIGHEATAKLIEKLLGVPVPVNRSIYEPENDDVALVFRLRKRLTKPEDVQNVKEGDLQILLLHYKREW